MTWNEVTVTVTENIAFEARLGRTLRRKKRGPRKKAI
jgi:hypothetical protein